MRMLIDTNVIMDVLVGREPFLQHSQYVVKLCTNRVIQGYIAAHTITNLFYILRKYYNQFKDVEDCLQMECGRAVNAAHIVTRNVKDFTGSSIPCLTPDEVCAMYVGNN